MYIVNMIRTVQTNLTPNYKKTLLRMLNFDCTNLPHVNILKYKVTQCCDHEASGSLPEFFLLECKFYLKNFANYFVSYPGL